MATVEDLYRVLRTGGIQSAGELRQALRVSQPTVSRLIRAAGSSVLRLGAARSTRYALKRPIADERADQPLFAIDAEGIPEQIGVLTSVYHGCVFQPTTAPHIYVADLQTGSQIYDEAPWFIQDRRPQGFLGRIIATSLARELSVPADARDWSSDHILRYMMQYGSDVPGDLVLGRRMLERAVSSASSRVDVILPHDKERLYLHRVRELQAGEPAGSSAAGERPKFTAVVEDEAGERREVIVKYVADISTTIGKRWKALLELEHRAAEVMREAGMQAATTRCGEHEGIFFLEVERFDRTARGRRATTSLEALSAGLLETGLGDTWLEASDELLKKGLLTDSDALEIRRRYYFGALIGNTDMHFGNLTFFVDPNALRLAPSYDMLPMAFRPTEQGVLLDRPLSAVVPLRRDLEIVAELRQHVDRYLSDRRELLGR